MKNIINKKSPFYPTQAGDIKCKVFVVGQTPNIQKHSRRAEDPQAMRGIHTHFAYEVFFVTSGRLVFVTQDYSKAYEKSILIIPPRLKHYSLPDGEGSFCLLFTFDETSKEGIALKNRIGEGVCELPLNSDLSFYINQLAQKQQEGTEAAERDAQLLVSLIFNGIVSALLPEEPRQGKSTSTAAEHIGAIETFINRNLTRKLTLSDVAQHVFLSTKQISRIIEKEYGCSFSELVTTKRLASAEMLLKNSDMKVSEIAAATCPGPEAYFYVLFKKRYGVSPLKYRRESKIFQ